MPFRVIGQFEALTSDDLNLLQEAYELAVADLDSLDDTAIHHAVESMIAHYRLGITGKEQLAEIATDELRLATG